MLKPASDTAVTDLPPGLTPGLPDHERRAQWQTAFEGNRDQWDRPKIVKPNGKEWGYRRASSYGSPLEYEGGLTAWKLRQVARGVAHSEVLQLEVTRAEVDLDSGGDAAKRAKKKFDERDTGIVARAMDEVGSGDKAAVGTAMHAVYERLDLGLDPGVVPPAYRADLEAYRTLTSGLFETASVEEIIVEDEFEVAGTYDRCLRLLAELPVEIGGKVVEVLPQGAVIGGDVKTSQTMDFAGPKFGCQCREYFFGTPWNPVTRTRMAWEDDDARCGWGHAAPRRDWAVILHVPSGQGVASLHWVNLAEASVACAQAAESYRWRGARGKKLITAARTVERTEDFAITAASATSVEELRAACDRAKAANQWTDELKAAFTARRLELEGVAA